MRGEKQTDLSGYLSDEELRNLTQWTATWYRLALESGRVTIPFTPDGDIIRRLHGCYKAELKPAEALQVCFSKMH